MYPYIMYPYIMYPYIMYPYIDYFTLHNVAKEKYNIYKPYFWVNFHIYP